MKRAYALALFALVAVAMALGGYRVGRNAGSSGPAAASSAAAAPAASASRDRVVLYWHDPMVPGARFDRPGKSPFMDMALVPVYADAASDAGVVVSPRLQQSLGVRTTTARRVDVASSFDAVGTVQFDERRVVAVQARVAGYVERLDVRATMERVRKGQALAVVFAPDWLGPQNEWLALKRAGVTPDLVDAARERMRALSIPESLLRRSEEAGVAQARFTLDAPVSGVVTELGVREGVAVAPGATLFRIAGLEKVWAVAEVPEAQAVRLSRGQRVEAVLQADERRAFDGALDEILPQVNASTRTLQARFEVDNREGRLAPGMLLRLRVEGPTTSRLVVPAEAVIRTGTRAVVILRGGPGGFAPREVELGADLGDRIEVVRGLSDGDEVVASGQFLIDSEARLKSVLGAMSGAPASAPSTATSASRVGSGQ